MKYQKLLIAVCILIGIAVSIKSFREPDLWWQIRTGEWILQHHAVPKQDVFSYTMQGTEWINIKWGFEVLAALVSKTMGPESVFILQSLVNCLLIIFLFKLSLLFIGKDRFKNALSKKTLFFSGAVSFLLLMVGTEYRMIGRPEMFSHLFTVLFLYQLEKNRQSPSSKIYLLVPLQMLWANVHEAFGIGIVILLIYSIGAWMTRIILADKKNEAMQLSLVTLASIASVTINPNGVKLMTRPFNIMNQVYANKYTTELLGFSSSEWWKKEAYIGLIFSMVCIVFILAFNGHFQPRRFTGSGKLKRFFSLVSVPYLIVILAFLYLGLTAYRNLVFLTLTCFPVINVALFSAGQKWMDRSALFGKIAPVLSMAILISFYLLVVSNKYYSYTGSRDRFGLEVLSINNPVGAADYIQKNNLQDKVCFSDYLTSSYLLWKLQPDFKTYIDLRDLDIFPSSFFNDFMHDVSASTAFHRIDSIRHFDYAVVFRPQFNNLHAYLYNDSIYALKYVDAVAAVYEKTDNFTRDDIFETCKPVKAGAFANAINKILNPLYSSYAYSKVDNDYVAANYYLNVGRVELAKQRADKLALNPQTRYKSGELMGQIYFRSAMQEPNDSSKARLLGLAEESYLESLRDNKGNATSFLGLGSVHYAQNNFTAAISDFTKCLAADDDNYDAHISIAQCYRELLESGTPKKEEYLGKLLHHFLKADALSPGNPMVTANIGFVYFKQNDCENARKYFAQVAGKPGLGSSDSLAVLNCLRQCGY